jgi:aryl-alcohol dehydrogenase-like predicted oxidoreductase
MVSTTLAEVGRRPFSPWGAELSRLALDLGRTHGPGPTAVTVGTVRRAREAGITVFDATAAEEPAAAEALLRQAFPEGDRSIVLLRSSPAAKRGTSRPPSLALGGARRPGTRGAEPPTADRVPPQFRSVTEVDLSRSGAGPPAPGEREAPAVAGADVARCSRVDDLDRVGPGLSVLSGPFSLLERSLASAAARRFSGVGFGWVARDPFAGGRLDGELFRNGPGPPTAPPLALRRLEAEFGPVAPLAFLALPRRRTLAQAALHYLDALPWVTTIVVPPPPPERWAEIVGFASAPPLTAEERARVDALPSGGRTESGPGGPR